MKEIELNETKFGFFWAMEDWWHKASFDEYVEVSDQATEMFGQKTSPAFLSWFIQFTKLEYCRSV